MKKRMKSKMKKSNPLIKEVQLFLVGDKLQMKCQLTKQKTKEAFTYAFYVYKAGKEEAVFKSKYTPYNTYELPITEAGSYRVKVFVKKEQTNEVVTQTSDAVQRTIVADF
ncbi:Uncharacterised protein [Listeria grayi]|nr:hypothetical protein [Listeria grayi]MBC1921524.1 hypothetical protein [Listeria grayi]VEI31042.1 Uncharacterised protein [Listeria grayi]